MGKKVMNPVLRERLEQNFKLRTLYERAKSIKPVDAAHDFSHMERVAALTLQIYARELESQEQRAAVDSELDQCIAAALLHDCVPIAKNSPLRKDSSRLSSEKAREWLNEMEFANNAEIDLIAQAVLDHSYSSGRIPTSLLGQALQDADRLESLGALGLYRTIATGVAMGAELFNSEDPWAEKRELNDLKFSLDHFFTKLLKLPESFRTDAARAEAHRRADFLRAFVTQLQSEITP
ncbi:MAG: HD domain-containing protein [Bdellovibrionales bacterium]|nr:HD domain-containing protein [Oligoflexia bacterium]